MGYAHTCYEGCPCFINQMIEYVGRAEAAEDLLRAILHDPMTTPKIQELIEKYFWDDKSL